MSFRRTKLAAWLRKRDPTMIGADHRRKAAEAVRKAAAKIKAEADKGKKDEDAMRKAFLAEQKKSSAGLIAFGKAGMDKFLSVQKDPSQLYNDPQLKARLDAGVKTADASAAAGGTLLSGGHVTELFQQGTREFAAYYNETLDRLLNQAQVAERAIAGNNNASTAAFGAQIQSSQNRTNLVSQAFGMQGAATAGYFNDRASSLENLFQSGVQAVGYAAGLGLGALRQNPNTTTTTTGTPRTGGGGTVGTGGTAPSSK